MTTPPPPFQPDYHSPPAGLPSGLARAGMVCGSLSLALLGVAWPASLPLSIVALVLSGRARRHVRRGTGGGGRMALAGLVCGGITLALFAAFAVVAVLAVITAALSDGHR